MTHKRSSVPVNLGSEVATATDVNLGSGVCHGLLTETQAAYVSLYVGQRRWSSNRD